jgi:hypothetical protein
MRHAAFAIATLFGMVGGCIVGSETETGTARAQLSSCDCPGDGFGLGTFEVPNAEAPHNWTMSVGWNSNAAGNPVVQGEPVLYDTWESNWLTPTGARWVERHWQYRGADGTFRRPLTMIIDRDTHAPQVHVAGKFVVSNSTHSATRVNVLDAAAGQASVMLMGNPTAATPIRCDHNGSACIQQRGASGATVHVVNVDGADRVWLGGAGAQEIRFGAAVKPIVNDCEDLAGALDAMGLVDYQP